MVFLYILFYGISLGPVVWLYNAEILPESGVSISVMCNWTGVIIVTLLFPICETRLGDWPIFLFFACSTTLGMILILKSVRETSGLNF